MFAKSPSWLIVTISMLALASEAPACPFCSALSPSLFEEFALADYVAIASCTRLPGADAELPLYSFHIEERLPHRASAPGAAPLAKPSTEDLTIYSQQRFQLHQKTLMFGVRCEGEVTWAPMAPMSAEALDYARSVIDLRNALGSQTHRQLASLRSRELLRLYWQGLESEDEWVRQDAYNSLATFSVDQLRPWSREVDPSTVKSRISQARTSRDHRRFYWTVLGLCGSSNDAEFVRTAIAYQLEQRAVHPFADEFIGLDAALSCLLLLGGEGAMQHVEREFLQDASRHTSERFAALSALRVHAQEFGVVEHSRISRALALLLEDAEFADQVIPDLARLQDWSHVDRLRQVVSQTGPQQQFMLVPAINYFRVCPLPQAKTALEEAKQFAPAAYRRALTMLPTARPQAPAVDAAQ